MVNKSIAGLAWSDPMESLPGVSGDLAALTFMQGLPELIMFRLCLVWLQTLCICMCYYS